MSLVEERPPAPRDTATIEGLKAELATLLQNNTKEAKPWTLPQCERDPRLQRESAEGACPTKLQRSCATEGGRTETGVQTCAFVGCAKDQKIELSATKEVVELADNKQQNDEHQDISDLKEDWNSVAPIAVMGRGG